LVAEAQPTERRDPPLAGSVRFTFLTPSGSYISEVAHDALLEEDGLLSLFSEARHLMGSRIRSLNGR
jgi:hypothetical protein